MLLYVHFVNNYTPYAEYRLLIEHITWHLNITSRNVVGFSSLNASLPKDGVRLWPENQALPSRCSWEYTHLSKDAETTRRLRVLCLTSAGSVKNVSFQYTTDQPVGVYELVIWGQ